MHTLDLTMLPLPPEAHDALCRLAATRLGTPGFCRIRRCRRNSFCAGRMAARTVPGHLAVGLPFTAQLPLCAAGAPDEWLAVFIEIWRVVLDELAGNAIFLPVDIRPPAAAVAVRPLSLDWSPEPLADVLKRYDIMLTPEAQPKPAE